MRPFDWCQNQRPRMTLNGRYALCRKKMRLSESTTKIWTYCQRRKCRPMTLVSGNIRFMRIFAGVLRRGGVKRQWGNQNVDFQGFWTLCLRHLRKWGQHYYTVLLIPLSPFQWPQNIWPWMTVTGYLASNSVFAPVWLAETSRLRKVIAWKLIKIDTYCQRRKSPAWSLVSGDIRFVRYSVGFSRNETLKDSGIAR